jgi:hypothetical protein
MAQVTEKSVQILILEELQKISAVLERAFPEEGSGFSLTESVSAMERKFGERVERDRPLPPP